MKYDKTYIFIFDTITTNVFVSIYCWYDGKWYINQNAADLIDVYALYILLYISYKVSMIMVQEEQNA